MATIIYKVSFARYGEIDELTRYTTDRGTAEFLYDTYTAVTDACNTFSHVGFETIVATDQWGMSAYRSKRLHEEQDPEATDVEDDGDRQAMLESAADFADLLDEDKKAGLD